MQKYSKWMRYSAINSYSTAVTGMGACRDKNIVIPEQHNGLAVIRIAQEAFRGNKNIESVIVPEGVRSVGAMAFKDCISLKEVHLPSTLDVIEDSAFEGCTALKEVDLPKAVKWIQKSAFRGCNTLERINLNEVSIIRDDAFKGCVALDGVDIGLATSVADYAFADCAALVDIRMPKNTCEVSVKAFENCGFMQSDRYKKSNVNVIDGWIVGCRSDEERYFVSAEVKGILYGAFDAAKRIIRTPNPDYEEKKRLYDAEVFYYYHWYELGDVRPESKPTDPPKEFFEEKIPIVIHYSGEREAFKSILNLCSLSSHPFDVVFSDGSSQKLT